MVNTRKWVILEDTAKNMVLGSKKSMIFKKGNYFYIPNLVSLEFQLTSLKLVKQLMIIVSD